MKDPRFRYALEAIVPVKTGLASPQTEMELLCRSQDPPWVQWYAQVPGIVLNAVQNFGVTRLAVNLDTQHILNPRIAESIARMGQLPVDIEWTENVSTPALVEKAAHILVGWRDQYGFGLSIDDVGCGQDGYQRARLTDARRIKIAGPAFQEWRQSARQCQMIHGLIDLYRSVDIDVVVEWVETLEDVAQAEYMGATHTQGRMWRTREIMGIL